MGTNSSLMELSFMFKIYVNDVSVSHKSEGHGHGHETHGHMTTSSGHREEHKGIPICTVVMAVANCT